MACDRVWRMGGGVRWSKVSRGVVVWWWGVVERCGVHGVSRGAVGCEVECEVW